MKVKAAEGLQVPREEDPRTYIGEEVVEVDASAYYIRRLAAGELEEVLDVVVLPVSKTVTLKGKE